MALPAWLLRRGPRPIDSGNRYQLGDSGQQLTRKRPLRIAMHLCGEQVDGNSEDICLTHVILPRDNIIHQRPAPEDPICPFFIIIE